MIKLIGCILLISCSSMMGAIKASSFRSRRSELENIIEILKLMDIEITYKKDPLAKSFQKAASMRTCWFSSLLEKCSQRMKEHKSLAEAWKYAMDQCRDDCCLKDADIDILDDLMMAIGKSDSEGQRKLFEPTIWRLQANLKEAYTQEKKSGKMYLSLGTAAGVVTAILLI